MVARIRVLAMIEAAHVSGSAKAVLEFAREAAHGHAGLPEIEISILTFARGVGETCLIKAVRNNGTPLDVVSERGRFDTAVLARLRSIVAERRIDLIWSNSVKSHFLVRLAGLHRISRWVAFHHGYTHTDLKMQIYNQLDRWSLPGAHRILTSSASFIDELEGRSVRPESIHVQHMPIRPFAAVSSQQKAELRHTLGIDDRTQMLLSVGRLSREKGHIDLVHAFSIMRKRAIKKSLRLVLVGEGPERIQIEELCCRLGLTDSVILAGQQESIAPYFGIADIFLLPSHTEGCPNVLLEAMAAGVPVVATRVGGTSEIVTDGQDAMLVEKHGRAAMAEATTRILDHPHLRQRLISSARGIVARKTPEAYFKSIATIFEQACANGN